MRRFSYMIKKLEPLDIKCSSTDCEKDLHYFRASKKFIKEGLKGHCRDCKKKMVDWARVHQRNISDIDYTVQALNYEMFRNYYWNKEIDLTALNKARMLTEEQIREAAYKVIRRAVGKPANNYDGRQTPLQGNIIFYAQHATATCCRKCIETWHNIPTDVPLTKEQIDYFVNLIMYYIRERYLNTL